jgi:hypothetical protein
MTNDGSLPAF